jgi:hypothetical protein
MLHYPLMMYMDAIFLDVEKVRKGTCSEDNTIILLCCQFATIQSTYHEPSHVIKEDSSRIDYSVINSCIVSLALF